MKKFLLILALTLISCQTLFPGDLTPPPTLVPLTPTLVSTTDAPPSPTLTFTPHPEATATLDLPDTPPISTLSEDDFNLRVHPDGNLFVGDQISFEVIAPRGEDLSGARVSLVYEVEELGNARFQPYGIGGRQQATLWWVWDTANLTPGMHTVRIIVDNGPEWTEAIELRPASEYVYPEPDASWATLETDCCVLHYVTGSAAARDLPSIASQTEIEAESVSALLGADLSEPVDVVFLPRVMGHGGFAGGEISVSYLDRNYAGNAFAQVLHHELVHILDRRLGGEFRPTMFVEGLAVYLSGGHFKKEDILARTAALLPLDAYLPLAPLANDFYNAQHEISYQQAAALVGYMVERWGWDVFDMFYRGMTPDDNLSHAEMIDIGLQEHLAITLDELETDFIAYLESQPEDTAAQLDMRLTVEYFDTLRRYQSVLDPSAYFLTAWLPHGPTMRERGIVADYLRSPREPANLALETMLVQVDATLRAGDYAQTEVLLGAINRVLDAFDADDPEPFRADPLAVDYLAIVDVMFAYGWMPQRVMLDGNEARAYFTQAGAELFELELRREADGWQP